MSAQTQADLAELRRVIRKLPESERSKVESCRREILALKSTHGEQAYALALAWVGLWEQESALNGED